MNAKGLMLVLSAPSGAGKTTLGRRLIDAHPDGLFSVSVTTRAPRGGEVDGVDYTFVDRAGFEALRERGELLEWAEVHGALYGTPDSSARAALEEGRLVVFDIDVQGGTQIKARHPEATTVLILPPSPEELERRLRARGTDDEEVIRRRLEKARAEIAACVDRYDYLIVNDRLDHAYAELSAIVRHLRGVGSREDAERAAALRLRGRESAGRTELAAWV